MAKNLVKSIILSAVILVITASYFFGLSIFSFKYADEVSLASKRYTLPEQLIRSVILVESGYDEGAVSRAGAEGLMQMMPTTRAWMSEITGITADRSPKSEILLGSAYLRYLLDLTGNLTDALMSYNAGYTNLQKWKEGGTPFPETLTYVKRVFFAMNIDRLL